MADDIQVVTYTFENPQTFTITASLEEIEIMTNIVDNSADEPFYQSEHWQKGRELSNRIYRAFALSAGLPVGE